MSLYTRYRPRTFDEMVGDVPAIANLRQAVADDNVGHAYIFAGPRGTGKTTTARILAKAIGAHDLDILEMDAASTRGIDDIRALRQAAALAPHGDAKVYILDEAHQLTREAWDALLKTLEEPPARTYFILATSSLDKVPETIRSRCQTFLFPLATYEDISTLLCIVADAENMDDLEPEAVSLIARAARGSYRDALTILEQLAAGGDMSVETLRPLLGIVQDDAVFDLVDRVADYDIAGTLNLIDELAADGKDLGRYVGDLLEHTRYLLVARHVRPLPDTILLAPEAAERLIAQSEALGWTRILELADRLPVAADVASRPGGNTRLALEAAVARVATKEN